jgi:predicted transcriptional regulator
MKLDKINKRILNILQKNSAITNAELANKIGSSQPRIAKAENGDPSVSLELLIPSLLATGATPQDIGQIIASVKGVAERAARLPGRPRPAHMRR